MNLNDLFGTTRRVSALDTRREEIVQRFADYLLKTANEINASKDPEKKLFQNDGMEWISEQIEALDESDTFTGEDIARMSALYFLLLTSTEPTR